MNYVAQKYQPLINNAGIITPQQQNNQYFGASAAGNGRGYSSNGNRAAATIQNATGNMMYQPGQQQVLSGLMTPTGPSKTVFGGNVPSQQRKNSRPSNAA